MKPHKHAEVLRAIADGKKVQYVDNSTWVDSPHYISPITHDEFEWRIKPTKKPVDLSVLIDSGIDCEFWDKQDYFRKQIGDLYDIDGHSFHPYECVVSYFDRCRPRMNHWHSWQGGDCPLPEGFIVDVVIRTSETIYNESTSKQRWWKHDITPSDKQIVAFRVVGLDTENYCYPWEIEE